MKTSKKLARILKQVIIEGQQSLDIKTKAQNIDLECIVNLAAGSAVVATLAAKLIEAVEAVESNL